MKLNYLLLNTELEETTSHGKKDYPLEVYTDEVAKYPEGYICWHWHKEHELLYVLDGEIELYTGQKKYHLKKHEGAWIVPNMLHMMKPLPPAEDAVLCAILVDTSLLCGFRGSRIHQKYVMPLFEDKHVDAYIFREDNHWQKRILYLLARCYELYHAKGIGYEWELVVLLQQSGVILAQNMGELLHASHAPNLGDYLQVKKGMEFIQKHYSEKIYLQDIAASIPISRCECCRSFKKVIHQSPVDYLISYRVRMAEYLLLHTDKSILEIALETGFSNSSHFIRMFQKQIHCTPLKYRRRGGTSRCIN